MAFVLIETEALDKLFEELEIIKQSISTLAQSGQLAGGENEWEYYTLDQALNLLGVKKKS